MPFCKANLLNLFWYKEVTINTSALKNNYLLNYIFGKEIRYFLKICDEYNIILKITDKHSNEEIYQKSITDYGNIVNLFKL